DADLVGTWWLTEKLRLEDDDQLSDLSGALGLSTTDADRLVRHFAVQVADVLFGATEAEPSADDAPPVPGPGEPAVSGPPGRTAPAEPEAIARLRDAGFIEYAGVEEADVVRLPASGLRIVVVSTPDAQLRPDHALLPILSDLAADG